MTKFSQLIKDILKRQKKYAKEKEQEVLITKQKTDFFARKHAELASQKGG